METTYISYGIEVNKKDYLKMEKAEMMTGMKTCLICNRQIRNRFNNFAKHVHSCCAKTPSLVDRTAKIWETVNNILGAFA